jgi:hypothetical protein
LGNDSGHSESSSHPLVSPTIPSLLSQQNRRTPGEIQLISRAGSDSDQSSASSDSSDSSDSSSESIQSYSSQKSARSSNRPSFSTPSQAIKPIVQTQESTIPQYPIHRMQPRLPETSQPNPLHPQYLRSKDPSLLL